jgi:hypothetical protein
VKSHQKVKNTETQHFKGDACMSMVVEPVEYFDAQAAVAERRLIEISEVSHCENSLVCGILVGEFFQSINFQLGSFSVFFDVLDDLERHRFITVTGKTHRIH